MSPEALGCTADASAARQRTRRWRYGHTIHDKRVPALGPSHPATYASGPNTCVCDLNVTSPGSDDVNGSWASTRRGNFADCALSSNLRGICFLASIAQWMPRCWVHAEYSSQTAIRRTRLGSRTHIENVPSVNCNHEDSPFGANHPV